MQNNIPISVIMPVYNSAAYVKEAIESILSQTFKDFEFIIIDDGSSDNSKEIISMFTDKRIILLTNESNKGLIDSLNKAIDVAKGKYIVRMDADDISLPTRIQKQVAFMEANPDVGVAGCEYFSLSGNALKKVYTYNESEVLRTMLMFNSCLCHPTAIIRKKLLTDNLLHYDKKNLHAEDYGLWIELSKISKLSSVKEFLFKYRAHSQQVTKVHNAIQKDSAGIIRLNYLKYLGFTFTDIDFETHTIVATNQLITSKEQLHSIEKWFTKLILQNEQLQSIEPKHFNFFIGKLWYDSCGITNLGKYAYQSFFKSPLHTYFPLSGAGKAKLLAKCAVRKFKK